MIKEWNDESRQSQNKYVKLLNTGSFCANLWDEINKILIEPFANLNYGYAITIHKSQGSTYDNVFVDIDDILQNTQSNEIKRCVYTSITRSSGKVFLALN